MQPFLDCKINQICQLFEREGRVVRRGGEQAFSFFLTTKRYIPYVLDNELYEVYVQVGRNHQVRIQFRYFSFLQMSAYRQMSPSPFLRKTWERASSSVTTSRSVSHEAISCGLLCAKYLIPLLADGDSRQGAQGRTLWLQNAGTGHSQVKAVSVQMFLTVVNSHFLILQGVRGKDTKTCPQNRHIHIPHSPALISALQAPGQALLLSESSYPFILPLQPSFHENKMSQGKEDQHGEEGETGLRFPPRPNLGIGSLSCTPLWLHVSI